MSKIQEYLEQIRLARYGKDVRQAIHDAIHQCYEDGKAGEVDLIAREGVVSLREDVTEMQEDISKVHEDITALNSRADALEIKTTKERTNKGTKHGGFRLTKMLANTVQNGTPSPSTPFPLYSTGDCVELIRGGYSATNGVYSSTYEDWICNKYSIPCKAGDVVKITDNDKVANNVQAVWYNDNGYLSYNIVDSSNTIECTAPSGATRFNFNANSNIAHKDIGNVGKITITINGKYLGCAKTVNENSFGGLAFAKALANSGATSTLDTNAKTVTLTGNADVDKFSYTDFKENTQYTFFFKGSNNSTSAPRLTNLRITYTDGTYQELAFVYAGGHTALVSEANKTISKLGGTWQSGVATFEYEYFGIMEGVHTVKDFVPHKETIAWYTTQYPMIGGSTQFKENGLHKAEHTYGEVVLNGHIDETWRYNESNGLFYTNIVASATKVFGKLRCSHYPNDTNAEKFITTERGNGVAIWIYNNDYNGDVNLLREALQSSPITVQYELATPIIETLDNASQIALNSLETFDGVTYVEFDTRVQPLGFEAEAGTSQVGAYTLKALNNSESNAVKIEDAIDTMLLITP